MKKNEFIAKVNAYNEYAKSVDCHVKPEKGMANGADGRSYEITVKLYLGNYKSFVAGAGKADTTKKGLKIEIKSGCGELGVLDVNGKLKSMVKKSDYVFYSPFYTAGDTVEESTYVLTSEDFFTALEEAGLIRKKVSSSMNKVKKSGGDWYYDRLAIQSYMNSKKALNRWLDALDTYGMTVEDWKEMVGL